jgi:hypothetical protein
MNKKSLPYCFLFFLSIGFVFLNSCKKEGSRVDDYLPLKPGARYKYNYLETYQYVYESSTKKGVSTWTFLAPSADAPQIYPVQKSFTGDSIHILDFGTGHPVKDSIHFENHISTIEFQVQSDGKVALGAYKFDRFIQSDKTDTCFYLSWFNGGCLRKNVGLISLSSLACGNHCYSSKYTLIEGPY